MTTVYADASSISSNTQIPDPRVAPSPQYDADEDAPDRARDEASSSAPPEAETQCRRLTGLTVKEASISIGRFLNVYWHSLLEVDPLLRAALLPIRDCPPGRLMDCMTLLIERYPDTRGSARWALHLLGALAPVLDWSVVLAYARFPDPAMAEHELARQRRSDGLAEDAS